MGFEERLRKFFKLIGTKVIEPVTNHKYLAALILPIQSASGPDLAGGPSLKKADSAKI
jgi:hypothetical protein